VSRYVAAAAPAMATHDRAPVRLPDEPIHKLVGPLERFMHVEASSGIVLLAATVVALASANMSWGEGLVAFWQTKVSIGFGSFEASHSLKHWISDGLMALFFFVIGLEVKRELVIGELRNPRTAALPVIAALGGMVVPAAIYLVLQAGEPAQRGWGIPMATDIAFVTGCLVVLGRRIPFGLRLMLVSLAIVDDIGAILVIAVGYTSNIDTTALVLGGLGIAMIAILARLGARSILLYSITGSAVWFLFHESGVHATIAGVILGLLTPAKSYVNRNFLSRLLQDAHDVVHGEGWDLRQHKAADVQRFRAAVRESVSPVEYLETVLHPWISFLIVPLFALANACVPIELGAFGEPVAVAVMAGLTIGKPLGIVAAAWIAIRLRIAKMPQGVSWRTLAGGGFLAGIGFTMSLFIAGLALSGDTLTTAKVGVLGASGLSAVLGAAILLRQPRPS